MDLPLLAELALNGTLTGLCYSLVALGIVLIYKSSSVPNLSQGALIMLGAYMVLAFSDHLGWPIWLAILVAMALMFLVGFALERLALRGLAGQPVIMILMMTLGLDVFLRSVTMVVWGGTARPMGLGISFEPYFLGPVLVSRVHLFGAAAALIAFGALLLFFRSRLGVRLRAISDDYIASWSVGISVERGVALSWGLASVLAVAAGVVWGEIQGVDQTLSLLLLKGLTVAVLGGLDSVLGAIVGGILIGLVENVGSYFLDGLVGGGSRDLVVAAVLVLTVLLRRNGLFGREEIERI